LVRSPAQEAEAPHTVHLFDPCLARAIHIVDGEGQEIARVNVKGF
jgi:hydrogenase large subunit